MRMRKKKHGAERIAACSELLIEDTSLLATLGEEGPRNKHRRYVGTSVRSAQQSDGLCKI